MISAYLVLLLVAAPQPKPASPIDAWQANLADTKAIARYRVRFGHASVNALDHLRAWGPGEVAFNEDPNTSMICEWSCDGENQHLKARFDEAEKIEAGLSSRNQHHRIPTARTSQIGVDVLWNGEIQAEHHLKDPVINVHDHGSPGMALIGRAPTCWWGTFRFPETLWSDFGKLTPTLLRTNVGDYSNQTEIYQMGNYPKDWYEFQIYYDPNIGFLPRYVRSVAISGSDSTLCKEIFLIDAQSCKAGGFVPLEWYELEYSGELPAVRQDAQSTGDPPRPRLKTMYLAHIKAIEFQDFDDVASMSVDGVNRIAAKGGSISLSSKAPLTIDRLKNSLGHRLTTPRHSFQPTLDMEDLHPHLEKSRRSLWPSLAIATAALVAAALLWRRRKAATASILIVPIAASILSGCNPTTEARPRLSVRFQDSHVLYENNPTGIALTLLLRNDGSTPLGLSWIDGGCTCRQVDLSGFPIELKPGESRKVAVRSTGSPKAEVESYRFQFSTDKGLLESFVPVVLLAQHSLTPDSINIPNLVEDEGYRFEVLHRAVYRADEPPAKAAMLSDDKSFVIAKISEKAGQVSVAPEFQYKDTIYSVELKDHQMGLHKSIVRMQDASGNDLAEIPVVWRRSAFLSTVPERAILGKNPVRVSLRCPDVNVRFTSLISSPQGIQVDISSKTIALNLDEDAPSMIDDLVVVATSDSGRPPLRISVVRYSISR